MRRIAIAADVFLLAAKRGSMKAFVADGFRNLKRSTGKDGSLTTHNVSPSHKDAMVLWPTYKSMLKEHPVSSQVSLQ